MNTPARLTLALFVCFAPGCAADGGDGNDFYDDDGELNGGGGAAANGSGGGTTVVDSGGGTTSTGGSTSTGGDPDCSDAAKQVYLVDSNYQFIKFEPATMQFTTLGALSCPTSGTPNSMAVDRDGTAWVNYSNGEIFHVDVETLNCQASGYLPNQQGFGTLGMGFVSDAAGSNEETLYVTDEGRFGKIDTASKLLTALGSTTGQPEFTGTGLAELWAFAPPGQGTTSGVVQQLNKSNGTPLQNFPLSLPQPDIFTGGTAWAFAAWGGFFYIFYQGPNPTTDVYIFNPSNGSANLNRNLPNLRIVGAGVSTCAPTEPPK